MGKHFRDEKIKQLEQLKKTVEEVWAEWIKEKNMPAEEWWEKYGRNYEQK